MSLLEIFKMEAVKDGLSAGAIILIILMSLLQVSKININPWSWICKKIGNLLNADILKEVREIDKKLDAHIKESEEQYLIATRRDILEFCNSCMNKRRHTYEQFRFIIKKCDEYEKYIEDNHIKNGEISSAIQEIHRIYNKCIQENDFLKEGE